MIHAISYGGGVQSTALLVLAARGELPDRLALFADTGAEHPATLDYLRLYARPYAARHGIELLEVRHSGETLLERLERQSYVTIPMRLPNGAPASRGCTRDFKIRPIARELRRRGASRAAPAILSLGISLDEYQRMAESRVAHEVFAYPLVERRLDRAACKTLIARAGLPVPPKSACWMCPFTTIERWRERRWSDPDLFARAVALEQGVNDRRAAEELPPLWLTDARRPLAEALGESEQLDLFRDGPTCDVAGYCLS